MPANARIDAERLADRAADLVAHNGIGRVFVTLDMAATPPAAVLEVEFFTAVALADIVSDVATTAKEAGDVFTIAGGSRLPGVAEGSRGVVGVTALAAVPGANRLRLTVAPIGDYSTYTLIMQDRAYAFDPLLSTAAFKFRPGCFNTNCAPLGEHEPAADEPPIDYLAKDFHSFRHLLMNAMRERVPGWEPSSEADLDQVLIGLIAADADELSDFQDRVANEAYLGRARKRVSLARYGRLLDYHVHQGNQASTWLALRVNADTVIDRPFGVWTGGDWRHAQAAIFASRHSASAPQPLFAALNELHLYTWENVVTALDAGTTEADVVTPGAGMTQPQAEALRDLLRRADVTHLALAQRLNPATGTVNGVDKSARQVVRLLDGDAAAEALEDPVAGSWLVRVRWRESDYLRRRYCFVTACEGQPVESAVSAFHANLIEVSHGRAHRTVFRAPGAAPGVDDETPFERLHYRHYTPLANRQLLRGVDETGSEVLPSYAELPLGPLSYRATPPGGEVAVRSTLSVTVAGFSDPWDERADLVESQGNDDHFVVETDEHQCSRVVFGNNVNGRALPEGAEVTCTYQVGQGSAGNVGADTLRGFDGSASGFPAVAEVWNPLDVTDGRDPEPPAEILRRVPEAYRARQLRAVTLEDYAERAEELAQVSHARARYLWAGSWRTVRVSIDLKAGFDWDEEQEAITRHLDAVRLIGEDLEVRAARRAPVDVVLVACAHRDYWPDDLEHLLATEFSAGYTADGRSGFFHPDNWTFGQTLHASQIVGRALAVTGVERVLSLRMRRSHAVSGPATGVISLSAQAFAGAEVERIEVEPFEIVSVASDPDHLELGRIEFDVRGGRGQ